ncbi:Ribosomal protein L24 [Syntrophomonas zehnderi OL-4]|uniref:Large ribosomal subunit protein uL24 n=1 Tax=Syntrophomonas zehnderi OL-4 TaxID=690567 RepID=A0A0E4GAJ9_9FIRM|nr:50S ribosomal protein L24 [Syntrophomonas zehnderi]CFX04632.1 Ribosomal protein L24 [Syntrophomonas zehnderi OL-4]CFX35927.1 Ribosomal protein L24 [Syntrophomonas zehnderi OL-4]
MNIKKGDIVLVLTGKDAGRKGKVLKAIPAQNRVVVEGINKVKKHQRPTRAIPQGGILQVETPMNVSNVMLVCEKCNQPTRIAKGFLEDGTKVRVCKKCGEVVD